MKKSKDQHGAADTARPGSTSVFETILAYSTKKDGVEAALSALTGKFQNVRAIFDAPPEEIKNIPGIDAKAALLARLIRDLGEAYLKESLCGIDAATENGAKTIVEYFTLSLSAQRIERFATIFLDDQNRVMDIEIMHAGTINQTAVYPRSSVEAALKRGAAGLIFAHNHPSGDPTPSEADIRLITILDKTAEAMGLRIFDHMVIGRHAHWSRRKSK